MLSKILLTLSVIFAAFLVLRKRNESSEKSQEQKTKAIEVKKQKEELSEDMRMGAYAFVILTAGIGITMYYFQWQDDHTILTVNLYRESQIEPISYEVYKYQLEDKVFVTTEGLTVTVASSERMEIIGLD